MECSGPLQTLTGEYNTVKVRADATILPKAYPDYLWGKVISVGFKGYSGTFESTICRL